MNLFVISRDRWDYSPTMDTMPKAVKALVTVMVPKDQYKLYKASAVFSGVRAIACWPTHIDCVPKKRRFLYENTVGAYVVIDDDLGLVQWDAKAQRFIPAKNGPNLFMKRIEALFSHLEDGYGSVGAANTFMTSIKIKKEGTFLFDSQVPFCFAGFSADRPKLSWKTFFFTDISMPMQMMAKGHKVATYAPLAYNMRANKKLASTGTTPYRTEAVIKYSALALSQMMPGHVFGLKDTGNNGGGWSLQKTFVRPNPKRSLAWENQFMEDNKLRLVPDLIDLKLKTPMQDLFTQYRESWETAT